jgi:deoxyribonucleoside regulator
MSSEDILSHAAHLYYVLGMTQQETAERLGVPRIKAHRLLAEARKRGIVQITINTSSSSQIELETKLAERYDLSIISISPSDTSPDMSLSKVIGHYAAPIIQPMFRKGMTIAVAWGYTLKALASTLEPAQFEDIDVVPLLGSLSRRSTIDRFEAATKLAHQLEAECYYLPSPIICDSAQAREVISTQPMIREVLEKAKAADLALASVGGIESSTLRAVGFLNEKEYKDVYAAGAIGNFFGYYLDRDGNILDHPINDRVIGLRPDEALKIPKRIMISGGKNKVQILRKLLQLRWPTGLITDETTARALLT